MRSHRLSWVALVMSVTACGVFSADEPASSSGGSSSGGPAAPPEENAKPPGVDGKPLEGVFVSASKGSDQNDGSMTKPLATIAAGLRKGQIDGKRVLVCAETYAETLAWIDGVSAYGYFDCGAVEWKLDESKRATIASPKSPAVRVEAAVKPTRIEGFQIVAPDFGAGSPDEREPFQNSSVGVYVKSSSALTISKSTVRAGKGRDGIDGKEGPAVVQTDVAAAQAGLSEAKCTDFFGGATCANAINPPVRLGGTGGVVSCAGGATPTGGGGGGDGGHWQLPADTWKRAPKNGVTAGTALGGVVGPSAFDTQGGSAGSPGGAGSDGVNGLLAFGDAGPTPTDGSAGSDGAPGQGGGGGAAMGWVNVSANQRLGGSGGGAGAGGCPGRAGTPGTTGGASVALYVAASAVSVERSELRSGVGGRAGRGTLGSVQAAGQPGAAGGTPINAEGNVSLCGVVPCKGGKGGDGGSGGRAGVSGHGAAGPSMGVVHIGDAPKMDADTVITPGAGGAGQGALSRGGATVPAVPQGASEKIFKAQ